MVVSAGFAWGAAAFGPVWALVLGRWRAALVLSVGWIVAGLLAMAAGPLGAGAIWPIVAVWSGLVGRGLSELWLEDRGWRLDAIAVARDFDAAEAALILADAERAQGVERRW